MTKTDLIEAMLESYYWPQFSNHQTDLMVWIAAGYGADKVLHQWKEFQAQFPGHSPVAFREWFLEKEPAVIEFS